MPMNFTGWVWLTVGVLAIIIEVIWLIGQL